MSKIRIPTRWILEMAEKIKENPEISEIQFESFGSNVLQTTRLLIPVPPDEKSRLKIPFEQFDVWDFEYNPGD